MSKDTAPEWGFETRMIHAGQQPDPATGARAVPIYQTTSYVFDSAEHAQNLFALAEVGNIYTRIMNPTQHVLEERIAALEGGVRTAVGLPGALAVSSGQAAETLAILNLAESGDHVVSSPFLYGGTYNLLHYTLPKMGIEVSFVDDPDDLDAWAAEVRPNTRAFYAESIGNPKNDVLDFEGVSDVAHAHGVPLVVDNTVPTPYLCRPLEHGADIVVHSATKFIGGHGNSIGGLIVDGGTFDFGASGRHAMLTEPDPSYHEPCLLAGAGSGRLHPQGTGAVAARHRSGGVAHERLPCSCRASRRCRCAWSAMCPTPRRWPATWRAIRRWSGSSTPGWSRAPTTSGRRSTCPRGRAR